MKKLLLLLLSFLALTLVSCASQQDKAYEAQKEIHEERLELVENYQDCLEEAGEDKVKTESCDQYLKAAEALK